MSKYNASDLIAKVKELVAAYPDNQYIQQDEDDLKPLCLYTGGKNTCTDGAGCIMGQAMLSLYPELEDKLKEIDTYGETIARVIKQLGFYHNEEQAEYLTYIQKNQDSGRPWGRCL